MNKSDLVELKYLSEAEGGINVWSLTDIVNASVASNDRLGITGILFFDHGYFGQILEGDRSAVEETWSRIQNDTRHHNVELLGITEIQERRFPKWSMKLFDAKEFSEAFPQFAEQVNRMDDPYAEILRMMKQLWQKV
ncbi:BLUF domain-containing protein [Polynucleobacter sp. CS-Odin-A6]|uniref:BLUF domain-containing protein n=1 Tax=Polynucleobacter sp. CS-Odin-A6 TaxID=2689106 RepID=UPI001C0CFEFE|nr:BLUF domain-containing protein [Polynucleobacter sp. CS-Odin-A6]MBU3620645.1 BLUF domain-containing protein [Polynucleobacter sp. CS-Odin-A6]